MKNIIIILKTPINSNILISILLMGLVSFAQANDANFSKWKCKLCPDYFGWSGEVLLGFSYLNQDDLHFADFRGQDEQGLYLALDGNLHYQDASGYYFNLSSHDLGFGNPSTENKWWTSRQI